MTNDVGRGMELITSRRDASRPLDVTAAISRFEVVVIAASLGGVSALRPLIGALPASFPLPLLVCQHVGRRAPSVLADILGRQTSLRVEHAREGERPAAGKVYLAPPDRHLLVRGNGTLALSWQDRVNHCRPSADVLFRSAAEFYGGAVIAVVLTGRGRDGARGTEAIRAHGGFAIAQDEASSEAFEMPLAARDIGQADLVLELGQIAGALSVLAGPRRAVGDDLPVPQPS